MACSPWPWRAAGGGGGGHGRGGGVPLLPAPPERGGLHRNTSAARTKPSGLASSDRWRLGRDMVNNALRYSNAPRL